MWLPDSQVLLTHRDLTGACALVIQHWFIPEQPLALMGLKAEGQGCDGALEGSGCESPSRCDCVYGWRYSSV